MSIISTKFKLVFFAPSSSTPAILRHLFLKFPQQLGNIGKYDQCAFITRGTGRSSLPPLSRIYTDRLVRIGRFRPGPGADPTLGSVGQLDSVEEDRVEIVVNDGRKEIVSKAIQELKKVHPYDEVAYDVFKMEEF